MRKLLLPVLLGGAATIAACAPATPVGVATTANVCGGYGYVDEFPVSRLFRGARFGSLGGGTTETLRNLVGRKVVEHMDLSTGIHSLNTF